MAMNTLMAAVTLERENLWVGQCGSSLRLPFCVHHFIRVCLLACLLSAEHMLPRSHKLAFKKRRGVRILVALKAFMAAVALERGNLWVGQCSSSSGLPFCVHRAIRVRVRACILLAEISRGVFLPVAM